MIGTIIFWVIVVSWLAVGFKRQPLYYKRHLEYSKENWPSLYADKVPHAEAAWVSLGIALVWGWYELGILYRNSMILRMTKEERQKAELENARKIIADWEKQEKANFDKQLGAKGPNENYEYL